MATYQDDIAGFYADYGLGLDARIDSLRPQQLEAIEWAVGRSEPYLFVNAPTGSGKTLLLATYGMLASEERKVTDRLGAEQRWSYAVSTKALQDQVAGTFDGLPIIKGRGNFDCLIAEDVFFRTMTAAEAPCAGQQWCPHTGKDSEPYAGDAGAPCGYYAQRAAALESPFRCTNYAQLLTYYPLRSVSPVLLADEAHNVEGAVCDFYELFLSRRTLGRFGVVLPESRDVELWRDWAEDAIEGLPRPRKGHAKDGNKPDFGLITARKHLSTIANLTDDQIGNWLLEFKDTGVSWRPIWGRGLVVPAMLSNASQTLFASATLMGPDYIADCLGLPDGSWVYLDLPSTFPPEIRPINYAPVVKMNAAAMVPGPNEVRAKMQASIDRLIDYYIGRGVNYGLIHSVSKKYRDHILTESRWGFIMTLDADEHARKVGDGEASVLVTASHTEGWDGADELCRFIIMPKVPFPDLTDRRTKIRQEEDARSYDHKTLVAVVQGAGRGVRHRDDYCETWILDESWRFIHAKRGDWLPESFRDAYRHNVRF